MRGVAGHRWYRHRVTVLAPILARTPVSRIEDVVARMEEIDAALPPGDGVGAFNKLYLAVTRNVLGGMGQATFAAPAFLGELDVAFANLYFAALRAFELGRDGVPRAWLPLFDGRAETNVAPIQFALAGMNAHINRDLPVGLVETFTAMNLPMSRHSAPHADYEKVNDLLVATETSVKALYLVGAVQSLDLVFHGVDDVVAMWSVRDAREAAWTNGEALWHLRGVSPLDATYLASLDRMVGFAGRGLLIPTGTPRAES